MKKDRPFMVTFIGDMTILFSSIGIIATLLQLMKLNVGPWIGVLLLPVVSLIAAIGYLKLKSWGYWILVGINLLILLLAVVGMIQSQFNINYLGILEPVISLVFIFPTKKYFKIKADEVENYTSNENENE